MGSKQRWEPGSRSSQPTVLCLPLVSRQRRYLYQTPNRSHLEMALCCYRPGAGGEFIGGLRRSDGVRHRTHVRRWEPECLRCWHSMREPIPATGTWVAHDSSWTGFQITLSAIWPWHHFLASYSWAALALSFRAILYSHGLGPLCPHSEEQLYFLKFT